MRQSGLARRAAPALVVLAALFLLGEPRTDAGQAALEIPPEVLERQQQAAQTLQSGYASGPWDLAREICITYEFTDDAIAVERALRDAARDGGYDPRSIRIELERMRCRLP